MSKTANITEYLNSRKVELSSEEIALDAVSDIQALVKTTVDGFKAQDGKRQAAKSALEDFRSSFADVAKSANSAQVQIDQLEKQAKALGLTLPDQLKNYYKLMQIYSKDAQQGASLVAKILGMI